MGEDDEGRGGEEGDSGGKYINYRIKQDLAAAYCLVLSFLFFSFLCRQQFPLYLPFLSSDIAIAKLEAQKRTSYVVAHHIYRRPFPNAEAGY